MNEDILRFDDPPENKNGGEEDILYFDDVKDNQDDEDILYFDDVEETEKFRNPFTSNQNLDKKNIYLCTSHSKHKSYSKVKKFKNPNNNLFFIGQNLVRKMDELSLYQRNIVSVIVEN